MRNIINLRKNWKGSVSRFLFYVKIQAGVHMDKSYKKDFKCFPINIKIIKRAVFKMPIILLGAMLKNMAYVWKTCSLRKALGLAEEKIFNWMLFPEPGKEQVTGFTSLRTAKQSGPQKTDSEYFRKKTSRIFAFAESPADVRRLKVYEKWTVIDWAVEIRFLR